MLEKKQGDKTASKEIRTDLALEMRERFADDNVEVQGVVLDEEFREDGKIRVSTVMIRDKQGAEAMKKPEGTYITIEVAKLFSGGRAEQRLAGQEIGRQLRRLCDEKKIRRLLVAGLGNREVTPDSLGPLVIDHLLITRHLVREYEIGRAHV